MTSPDGYTPRPLAIPARAPDLTKPGSATTGAEPRPLLVVPAVARPAEPAPTLVHAVARPAPPARPAVHAVARPARPANTVIHVYEPPTLIVEDTYYPPLLAETVLVESVIDAFAPIAYVDPVVVYDEPAVVYDTPSYDPGPAYDPGPSYDSFSGGGGSFGGGGDDGGW